MKELGVFEEKLHRQVGKDMSKLGFTYVIGVGKPIKYLISELGKGVKTSTVQSQDMVLDLLSPYLKKGNY